MPKIEFPNMAAYMAKLGELNKNANIAWIINPALYEGARILADEVQKEISGLKQLNAKQRRGLHEGLGIAHFWRDDSGGVYTKIGFEGYNDIVTKQWRNGQPNAMIARAVQRGTSWMQPNRFAARAARKAREKAINKMRLVVEDHISAIFENGYFSQGRG